MYNKQDSCDYVCVYNVHNPSVRLTWHAIKLSADTACILQPIRVSFRTRIVPYRTVVAM